MQPQNESEMVCVTSFPHTVKMEQLSYRLGEDSDVICMGDKVEEIIEIEDDPATQDLFLQCNESSSNDSLPRENLITVHTQPSSEDNVK